MNICNVCENMKVSKYDTCSVSSCKIMENHKIVDGINMEDFLKCRVDKCFYFMGLDYGSDNIDFPDSISQLEV